MKIDLNDIINKKINKLVPMELIKKFNRSYYLCKCECGNLKEIKRSHIISGNIKSCGCYNIEILKGRKGEIKNTIKPNNYSAKYRVYKSYEKHAIERRLIFDINIDYFIEITSKNCYYCNAEPKNITKTRGSRSSYIYSGIDRVDNSLGYLKDNCVPCCKTCNIAKSNLTMEEFKQWVNRLYNNKEVFGV